MVVPGKIRQGERITLARVKSWWAKDRKYYRYSCNADQVEHVFVNLENKAIEMFRRGDLDMMNIRQAGNMGGQAGTAGSAPGLYRQIQPGAAMPALRMACT